MFVGSTGAISIGKSLLNDTHITHNRSQLKRAITLSKSAGHTCLANLCNSYEAISEEVLRHDPFKIYILRYPQNM